MPCEDKWCLLGLAVGLAVGLLVGNVATSSNWRSDLIKKGYGEFNATNGLWQYKDVKKIEAATPSQLAIGQVWLHKLGGSDPEVKLCTEETISAITNGEVSYSAVLFPGGPAVVLHTPEKAFLLYSTRIK